MKIVIHNLYGINNPKLKSYFRKQGTGCFDFVSDEKFASELTEAEALKIFKSADWYCKQYNASHMTIEGRETNDWRFDTSKGGAIA